MKAESQKRVINAPIEQVYTTLSDLNNLERVVDRLPQDKVKDISYDRDSCQFSISPVGEVRIEVVEREEFKTLKFGSSQSPVKFNLWLQFVPLDGNTTATRVTIDADVPFMLKAMAKKPIAEAVEKIAEALTMIHY